MIKELILASALAIVALPVWASQEPVVQESPTADAPESITEEQFLDSLNFRSGKVVIGNNLATLNLPDSLVFLDSDDAERVLVEAWGNPPNKELPLGMILPKGASPLDDNSWAVTVDYEESGYVSDKDAADINYGDLLKQMRKTMKAENQWRSKNGYEQVSLIGWASKPHYDAVGKKLHWAKEVQFGDNDEHILNYNIRVLGRKGVLVLNFIASMAQLPQIETNVPAVLAMTDFNQGNRYTDFNPDLDQVAAYGIGALIAGKAAAKIGLLAAALVLLKKLWFLPVLLGGWLWRRISSRRKARSQAAAAQPDAQLLAAEPVKSVADENSPSEPKQH